MRSPSALSSGRFSVPRLALPTCESPTAAAAGLTRSTRRVLSGTPGGARSPSPYGSPTRRSGTCGGEGEPAAAAELSTLATALGESLMAADLPAIVAHKRQADARLDDWKVDGVPAGECVPSAACGMQFGILARFMRCFALSAIGLFASSQRCDWMGVSCRLPCCVSSSLQ
jgi:hypothetical protein